MGNPHLAALTDVDVDGLDLTREPAFDAALFPEGVNVELVNVLEPGAHIRMRVFERGVGETRSCGTGACAAAYAALDRTPAGPRAPSSSTCPGAGCRCRSTPGPRCSPARPCWWRPASLAAEWLGA